MTDQDPWSAFSDSDDDEDTGSNGSNKDAVVVSVIGGQNGALPSSSRQVKETAISVLKQHCWQHNPLISLDNRFVALAKSDCSCDQCQHNTTNSATYWKQQLHKNGFTQASILEQFDKSNKSIPNQNNEITHYDLVVLILHLEKDAENLNFMLEECRQLLLPAGGCLLWHYSQDERVSDSIHNNTGNKDKQNGVLESHLDKNDLMFWKQVESTAHCTFLQLLPCQVQHSTCPWLLRKPKQLALEQERLALATVVPSSFELRQKQEQLSQQKSKNSNASFLNKHSLHRAIQALSNYGYCILRFAVEPESALEYGQAALADIHAAADILLQEDQIDLYYSNSSTGVHVSNYQELSLREYCRMDLRHGPELDTLRTSQGSDKPAVVTAFDESLPGQFLRGQADLLHIVRSVMHPTNNASSLYTGNLGRCNFGGRGPDGTCPNINLGIVGAVVSLPGSADQAVHADAPHLFEHLAHLPAHYINLFTPGSAPQPTVGQTALVHGSHRLDTAATYNYNNENHDSSLWHANVVRPYLNVGDVLLMDCRTWHFGLANTSSSIERPLLYTNITLHWFHDPKNWQNEKSVFKRNKDVDT